MSLTWEKDIAEGDFPIVSALVFSRRAGEGQGPAALLGQLDYVIEGAMIGGFALGAAPAAYRITAVRTFMDGVVDQKDLGPATLEEFRRMELFNPDETWTPVQEQ